MTSPAEVLVQLRTQHPTSPRLTWYGPDLVERIELSGRVLDNWVAKAANMLLEEFDAGPGTQVGLDLPAGHWRSAYWALGTWAVGATLVLAPSPSQVVDVLITSHPEPDSVPALIVVTPAALARRYPGELPAGALDEAAELATYGDELDPPDSPGPRSSALVEPGNEISYAELVPTDAPAGRVHLPAAIPVGSGLRRALGVWAAGGSIVVTPASGPVSGHPATAVADILAREGITAGDS